MVSYPRACPGRTDSVLASLDDAMLRAARSEGIAVLDGPDRVEPSP